MDLTRLTHTLTISSTTTQIEEPVGFDSLKVTLKRSDYHGISAEMSVGTLEFYGKAAEIIRTAYNSDINTEIVYEVIDETGAVFYTGQIDLSTYQSREDVYHSVSCKVGEIGVKTTFNNRTDVTIDLNTGKTVNGSTMTHSPKWNKITLPFINIRYTDSYETGEEDVVWNGNTTARYHLAGDATYQCINIPLAPAATYNEFGTVEQNADIAGVGTNSKISDYYKSLLDCGTNFGEKYGENSQYNLILHAEVTVKALWNLFDDRSALGSKWYDTSLVIADKIGTMENIIPRSPYQQPTHILKQGTAVGVSSNMSNTQKQVTWRIDATISGIPGKLEAPTNKIYLVLVMRNMNINQTMVEAENNATDMEVTVKAGSYCHITLDSNKPGDVTPEVMLMHDAFNRIVEAVSDNALHCRSTLMTYPTAVVNPGDWGKMSLLALTNGYKIRGIFSNGNDERGVQMSFKDAVQALEALTPIGWGLTDENGLTCLRVEAWDWFYNSDTVLTIEGANDKRRSVDTDRIITDLTIGYKKYTTNEEYNATNNIHSERTYNSGVTAISKSKSLLCAWIADNYAIEETRRKTLESKTTEEFKYDENIFVIELANLTNYDLYIVPATVRDPTHISYTYYNTRISPRRNAERWRGYLSLFNSQRNIRFISGKVNTIAAFAPSIVSINAHYIDSPDEVLAENDDLEWEQPAMKAEKIKIKYPLTLTQYRAIAANPYGLIVVDGEACWLKEMQYELATGEAELTLIPKIVQPNNNNSND